MKKEHGHNNGVLVKSKTNERRTASSNNYKICWKAWVSGNFKEDFNSREFYATTKYDSSTNVWNVAEESVSLFHHHRRTATTRNQNQQHCLRLWVNPYAHNSTGMQSSFLSLTAAARERFVGLSSLFLI